MTPFDDFRTIVNNNLITLSTDLDGRIVFASQAYYDISGMALDDVLGTHVDSIIHDDTSKEIVAEIWYALEVESTWHGELKFHKKDGDFYWVDIKIMPNFGDRGELQGYTAIMHDITDRKRVEELTQKVVEEEQLISKHLEIINDYIMTSTTDIHGTITSVSRAFCAISGYTEAALIGKNHNLIGHPDMPAALYKTLWSTISVGDEWEGEIKNRTKEGEAYWVDVYIKPITNASGEIIGYTAVHQDITDKKKLEELTVKDELTGAYNRRFYNQVLDKEINRAKRNNFWIGFLMADADHFKKYNDSYGHQAGDEVLKSITLALTETFRRSGDYVFRLGGEEFAVLYTTENKEQLLAVAERSLQAMYDMDIEHSGNAPHYRVTLSMGLMELNPELDYVSEEIYKYADEALYRAKQAGRNCIEAVDSDREDIELF